MTWFNNIIKVCYVVVKFHNDSNDARCRDMGREERTSEEVGVGGNEDIKMDEWNHQAGQN